MPSCKSLEKSVLGGSDGASPDMNRPDLAHVAVGAVLVVDDEPMIVRMISKVLSRHGHVVITAVNASDAIEALKEHAVDVLISDLRMPGTTGVELLATARREFPDVVRIAFSGANDLRLAVQCVNDGEVFRYLAKPCGAAELLEAVDAALGVRGRRNSPVLPRAEPNEARVEPASRHAYVMSERRIRALQELIPHTELEALSPLISTASVVGVELETAEIPWGAERGVPDR
jgi:DNA-binding NtrC family response regulator